MRLVRTIIPAGRAAWLEIFSWLAPAAVGLLPVWLLASGTGEKNEAYEWTQHLLAGLGFAAAFAVALLWDPWPRNWITSLAGAATVVVGAMVAMDGGFEDFDPLFAVAAAMVAAGYWLSRRGETPARTEALIVGLGALLAFWAASRLSWWQALTSTLRPWPNRAVFLGVTAALVWLLRSVVRERKTSPAIRLGRLTDAVVLAVLAAALLRTNTIDGNWLFPHHWSVYVATAEMVREGGVLLGNVASQYGFLNMVVLAALPTGDRFTALFWLNTVLVWISGAVIYFTLKTWLNRWWWQVMAGLGTVCCVAFLCGDAAGLTGPLPVPSVAAVRFIWLYVLLGYLAWWHRRATPGADSPRAVLWVGSSIWLLGVFWSVESALYLTAAWFPAASLLAMNPAVTPLTRFGRLLALFTGIGRALRIPAVLLAGALLALTGYYRVFLGHLPVWSQYWEYSTAFSSGFGALPIDPQGGIWAVLLLHICLVAILVGMDFDRRRASLALVWAAWGTLWVVSTYYISRSHGNNLTNLSPLLLLVVGLAVHAWGTGSRRDLAGIWIWLTVPALAGAMFWLVLTDFPTLKRQWNTYAVEPRTARLLSPVPPAVSGLIALCQQLQPGRYTVLGQDSNQVEKAEVAGDHADWLPLRSLPLLIPLPLDRRAFYLDAYSRGRAGGWLLTPVNVNRPDHNWLFDYINYRYSLQITLEHDGWQAEYYLPQKESPRAEVLSLEASGLPAKNIEGRNVRMLPPPAAVSWPLRGTERQLSLEIGCDPANAEGAADATILVVEITTPSGAIFPVYRRPLDPHQYDRGPLRYPVILPPIPAGSRLAVKTMPGPNHDNTGNGFYLAEASVVSDPKYSAWQFPGFNRVPDGVRDDVAYLEQESAQTVLALHAPASLTFRLHGGERSVAFDFGLRAGAYQNGGGTDGAGFRVTLRAGGQPDRIVFERLLQPVAQRSDQGTQHTAVPLPDKVEAGTELVLTIDPGPAGNSAWDWTYLANLRIN